MIVTISGLIGSGKTTLATALAKKFKLRHVSAGIIFRKMAKERRMTLAEFSKFAEGSEEIDREVDARQVQLAQRGGAVVDGRLSGWLVKNADIKIWLKASLEERAKRVAKRENKSLEAALRETKEREASEARRYKEIYGIDLSDLSIYDAILNTDIFNAEEVAKIIEAIVKVRAKRSKK